MEWTSRERVIAAINHIEPDRVPINVTPLYDFYINLKNYLGLEISEDDRYGLSMEVIPHPDVLRKLGVDISSVKLGSPNQPVSFTRSDLTDLMARLNYAKPDKTFTRDEMNER